MSEFRTPGNYVALTASKFRFFPIFARDNTSARRAGTDPAATQCLGSPVPKASRPEKTNLLWKTNRDTILRNSEDDDDFSTSQPDAGKSIRGYRIVIIILSVILVAISALYFSIHHQQMLDNELLRADRDSIQSDLGRLMDDYDNLQISNDSISRGLDIERERADSLMTQLKKERSWNLAKIKQYEKEVGTLRSIMKGYVRQIDSSIRSTNKLIKENVGYRKEISSAKLRAEMAEEKAAELDNKVKVGSVLRARDIRLAGLNDRGNAVSRVKNASRLRVDFVLSANELATPETRPYTYGSHPPTDMS